jgi:hypothetical protein
METKKRKDKSMFKKILIEENKDVFSITSADAKDIMLVEEHLRHIGIRGIACKYADVSTLTVARNQGDDVDALDKEMALSDCIDNLRPNPWANWETSTVAEILGDDERAYLACRNQPATMIKSYVLDGHAPKDLYDAFDVPPVASFDAVNWDEVAENLKE